MNMTEQGLVQVTVQELLDLPIHHFYSAADPECLALAHPRRCGSVTSICGFTEWISMSVLPVSIGWDWSVSAHAWGVHWRRVTLPRSNIQILNREGGPLRWEDNLQVLSTWVDAQFWVEPVSQVVSYTVPGDMCGS